MTEFRPNTTPTMPGHVPAKRRRRWVAPTAIGAVALLAGVGIGAAGEKTEVVTVEAEPITKTVTEEVEVTPQSCLDALDSAETLITTATDVGLLASEFIDFIPRAFEAGMNYDAVEAEAIITEMDAKTAEVEAMDATALRADLDAKTAQCRGAGV